MRRRERGGSSSCSQGASWGQSSSGSVRSVSWDSVGLGDRRSRGLRKNCTFYVQVSGVFGGARQDPLLGVTGPSQHEREARPGPAGRRACPRDASTVGRRGPGCLASEAPWCGILMCYLETTHFVSIAGMFLFQKCVAFSHLRVNYIVCVSHVTLVSLHGQPRASVRPWFRFRVAPEGTCARHSVF